MEGQHVRDPRPVERSIGDARRRLHVGVPGSIGTPPPHRRVTRIVDISARGAQLVNEPGGPEAAGACSWPLANAPALDGTPITATLLDMPVTSGRATSRVPE
jgi:hypothetical protein